MKLFALAVGARDRASSRLRVWDHVDWLQAQGHMVRTDSLAALGVERADRHFYARIVRRFPGWLRDFLWCDAALIQEALLLWPLALLKNFGKRRQLIFDFSDPIDRAGKGRKRRMRQWMFDIMIRYADIVVVENKGYLDLLRARGVDTRHFYGPVDAARYGASRNNLPDTEAARPLRIGWTGSPGTFRFIRPLLPLIDEIARHRAIEVMLIGISSIDHRFAFATPRLVEWSEQVEFELLPTFDLGLFRLEDDEDALWRGAGKLFIYMAAGVPFIATNRGIGRTLMQDAQVGFAVDSEEDWLDVLHQAAEGDAARAEMTNRSLAYALDHLSYEAYRNMLAAELGRKRKR